MKYAVLKRMGVASVHLFDSFLQHIEAVGHLAGTPVSGGTFCQLDDGSIEITERGSLTLDVPSLPGDEDLIRERLRWRDV